MCRVPLQRRLRAEVEPQPTVRSPDANIQLLPLIEIVTRVQRANHATGKTEIDNGDILNFDRLATDVLAEATDLAN